MRAGRGAWNPRTFEQIGRDAPPHARSRDPQMSPACAQAPDDRIADTDYSTTLAEMARIHLYPISKARWSLNSFLFERDRYRRISAGIPLLKSPISATLVRVEIASRPPVFTSDGLRQTADLPVDVANPTCLRPLSSSFQNSRIPPGRSFFVSPGRSESRIDSLQTAESPALMQVMAVGWASRGVQAELVKKGPVLMCRPRLP